VTEADQQFFHLGQRVLWHLRKDHECRHTLSVQLEETIEKIEDVNRSERLLKEFMALILELFHHD
jgi:hypothetical protein